MIGLYITAFLVVFLVGVVVGCCLGQWSIYRYYKRKTGRDFYPDTSKTSRGQNLFKVT